MDLFSSCKDYIKKLFTIPDEGMKILLVDSVTVKYISTLFVMSEIMDFEIYLVENIDSFREELKLIKCIAILRPTNENINLLSNELKRGLYSSYYLFFTNVLPKSHLQRLASSDEHELVKEVLEYYMDFIPNSQFQFNMDFHPSQSLSSQNTYNPSILTDSVTGALLTLGKIPKIFYDQNSDSCKRLAESVRSFVNREERFFRNSEFSFASLVIIDRKYDPITPLLHQWTYEAMIHELIGINNNKVKLPSSNKETVLSYGCDEFFKENQFANFGEIGESIKKLVDDYQSKLKSVDVKNVESIGDLKKFLENYPNFKKTSGAVETHFSILSELSKNVKDFDLMNVSECEQQLVCQENHSQSYSKIISLIKSSSIREIDAVSLVLLYIIRYPNNKIEIENLRGLLTNKGYTQFLHIIEYFKYFSHRDYSAQTLKNVSSISNFNDIKSANMNQMASKAMNLVTKKLVTGLRGVENVYCQHQPSIAEIVHKITRNEIKKELSRLDCNIDMRNDKSKDIIIFIIGGMTYAEVNTINKLNKELDYNIYIGSTTIHNSQTFIKDLCGSNKDHNDEHVTGYPRPLEEKEESKLGILKRNITSKITGATQYSKLN